MKKRLALSAAIAMSLASLGASASSAIATEYDDTAKPAYVTAISINASARVNPVIMSQEALTDQRVRDIGKR